MRTITEEIKLYTFEEADKELRDKIREHFDSYGNCFESAMSERIETLKKVAELLDATLDYSLSYTPDRGEFIDFIPKNEELDFDNFWSVINEEKDCPLTGCCYDHDFIDTISKYNFEGTLKDACTNYIDSIHEEYEYLLTDEALLDTCEANGYEFTIDGKIY